MGTGRPRDAGQSNASRTALAGNRLGKRCIRRELCLNYSSEPGSYPPGRAAGRAVRRGGSAGQTGWAVRPGGN
jgi:hypothetical protein